MEGVDEWNFCVWVSEATSFLGWLACATGGWREILYWPESGNWDVLSSSLCMGLISVALLLPCLLLYSYHACYHAGYCVTMLVILLLCMLSYYCCYELFTLLLPYCYHACYCVVIMLLTLLLCMLPSCYHYSYEFVTTLLPWFLPYLLRCCSYAR